MRNSIIQAAVAAAIAGASSMSASAGNQYFLSGSGASTLRTLFENDVTGIASGAFGVNADANGVAVCAATVKTTAALSFPGGTTGSAVPDLHALVCTISSSRQNSNPALPGTMAAGDTITLYYGAEFGSVWGIAPFLAGSTAAAAGGRMVLNPTPACAISSNLVPYFRDSDTAPANTCYLGPNPVDFGVSDLDPVFWANTDNWPVTDGLVYPPAANGTGCNNVINILQVGTCVPTLAALQTLEQAGYNAINGEEFTFITDATPSGTSLGPSAAITGLSIESLRSIFTGSYKTWSQVPEALGLAGNSADIVVCRRDHGSGSQVTLSKFLTLTECGGNNGTGSAGTGTGTPPRIVSQASSLQPAHTGSLANLTAGVGFVDQIGPMDPIENFSTNDVVACVAANPGVSIGWVAIQNASTAFHTLLIDGIVPNVHNAAFGIYPAIAEDYAYSNIAVSKAGDPLLSNYTALYTKLITDVSKATTGVLSTETGGMVAGTATSATQWAVTAGKNPTGNFYIQNSPGNAVAPPSLSAATESGNPSAPTAVWINTAHSGCTILVNNNKL